MNKFFSFRGAAVLGAGVWGVVALAGCTGGSSGGSTTPGVALNNSDTIAKIGDSSLTRGQLSSYLEALYGEQAIPQLIDYELVMQELKKKGLDVTDAEVRTLLDERRGTTPGLSAVLDGGGARLEALQRQSRMELAVQKILTSSIKVDDAKLKAYLDKYHSWYDEMAQVKHGLISTSQKDRAEVMAGQLKAKTRSFKQLVDEQKKAKDAIAQARSYEAIDEFVGIMNFPKAARSALESLPKGATSAPIAYAIETAPGRTTQAYGIFKVIDRKPALKATLENKRPLVELDYKLMQVAMASYKKLTANAPKAPSFDAQLEQTAAEVHRSRAAKLRDILNLMNQQTAATELVAKLRKGASVQIQDPTYASIGELYQAAPAPGAIPGLPGTSPAEAPPAPSAPAKTPAKQ